MAQLDEKIGLTFRRDTDLHSYSAIIVTFRSIRTLRCLHLVPSTNSLARSIIGVRESYVPGFIINLMLTSFPEKSTHLVIILYPYIPAPAGSGPFCTLSRILRHAEDDETHAAIYVQMKLTSSSIVSPLCETLATGLYGYSNNTVSPNYETVEAC